MEAGIDPPASAPGPRERMVKSVLMIGGGTAGWITAEYLARTLGVGAADGIHITLVESPEIATVEPT